MENYLLQNYLKTQQKLLNILGISLTKDLSKKQKYYSCFVIAMMLIYLLLVIPALFQEENFDYLINDLMFATGYIIVIVKVLALLANQSQLRQILNTFITEVLPSKVHHDKAEAYIWIKDSIDTAKLQTIFGIVAGVAIVTTFTILSHLTTENNNKKRLPFGSIMISEYCSYELALFYQVLIFGIAVITIVIVDVFFASVLAQLCVQCKIVQNAIAKMIEYSTQIARKEKLTINSVADIPWKYLKRSIDGVVTHHRSVIKLSQQIEEVSNIPALAVFTGMSICFCFILYQVTMKPSMNPSFFKSLIILLTAITSLFLNTYYGSKITHESLLIADSCLAVDFIGADVRFQKALRFIMQRTQKPIKITLGKFDPLSLYMIINILRISYNSVTLLRNIKQDLKKDK